MNQLILGILVLLALYTAALANDEGAERNEAALELFRQGKITDAVAQWKAAIAKDPKYLAARLNLAHAYETLEQPDEAMREYHEIIASGAKEFFAHNNIGVLYDKKGRYDEAISEFEKALQIRPGNSMALNNLAVAKKNKAIMQNRTAQIQRAESIAQAKPKDPLASYDAARLHAAYGNKDLALQWLRLALKQGYKESASIRTDPAFSFLRNDRDLELILLGK
jgi:Tfp pilus assembly protein PilF